MLWCSQACSICLINIYISMQFSKQIISSKKERSFFLWKLVSLFLATILSDFRKAVLRPLTSWIVAVQLEIHFPFLRQPLLFKKHTKEPEQYWFTKNTSCLCVTLFSKRTSVLYLIICGFQIAEREKGFQRCENLSASLLVQIFSLWREIFSLSLFCLLFIHCLF